MIKVEDKLFSLTTKSTSYLISITDTGHLEHLYYGPRLSHIIKTDIDALHDKHHLNIGSGTAYDEDNKTLFLENLCQETSTEGKGDYRIPMVSLSYGKGLTTLDFLYKNHKIVKGKPLFFDGNAQAYATDEEATTLSILLQDKVLPITLELYYTTFDACDVLLRKAVVTNGMESDLVVKGLDSLQLDLFDSAWDMITFNGAWARERIPERSHLVHGTHINESRSGVSSADHNPLIFLVRPDATEKSGQAIACNLIYSGNHKESIEVSPFGKTRLLTGINDQMFRWIVPPKGSFASPEAILTFSGEGIGKASNNFHAFINNHISRGTWKYRERPILLNSWEAEYFNFDEDKLFNLANQAHELGAELFVMDDGWFGTRNDDTTSLGDWYPNRQKLPSGLAPLANRVHNIGMMFGIWVEPEMVNMQSQLYLKHPDWMVAIPGRTPSVGRHQYILDMTRPEVREYLFNILSALFKESDINYVKWDMNRVFSDIDSLSRELSDMGEFNHRYILGLYALLEKFTKAFPNVLFEGCASGGNRYDLGMLCYFSDYWTSDNTDTLCRTFIQEGTSYGYPLSTMGCHVSTTISHQTLRRSNLESHFNVACFGCLGYELDVTSLSRDEKLAIADQISFFKQFRSTLQFGTFSRDRHDSIIQWTCASGDRKTFITLWMQPLNPANAGSDLLIVDEVDEMGVYDVFPRAEKVPLSQFGALIKRIKPLEKTGETINKAISENISLPNEIEHYTVSGSVLKYAGIKLNQQFSGTGWDQRTRVLGDFGSRLYIILKH